MLLDGYIERVSEGYAAFITDHDEQAQRVAAGRYRSGVLEFSNVEVQRAVKLKESYDEDGKLEIILAFRSLLTSELLFPGESVNQTVTKVTVPLGDDPSLAAVAEVVRRLFDLYENGRALLALSSEAEIATTGSPRVERLTVQSPLAVEVLGDPQVWDTVQAAIAIGASAGGTIGIYFKFKSSQRADREADRADREADRADREADRADREADRADREADRADTESEREGEVHLAALESMEIDNLAKKFDLAERAHELGIDFQNLTPSERQLFQTLVQNIADASFDIAANATDPIEIEADGPPDELSAGT